MKNRSTDSPDRSPNAVRQGVALRRRKMFQPIQHRHAELMQAGERKLHLGLHTRGPQDSALRRRSREVVQQRALADAGLAAEDDDLADARADARDDVVEGLALAPTAP